MWGLARLHRYGLTSAIHLLRGARTGPSIGHSSPSRVSAALFLSLEREGAGSEATFVYAAVWHALVLLHLGWGSLLCRPRRLHLRLHLSLRLRHDFRLLLGGLLHRLLLRALRRVLLLLFLRGRVQVALLVDFVSRRLLVGLLEPLDERRRPRTRLPA